MKGLEEVIDGQEEEMGVNGEKEFAVDAMSEEETPELSDEWVDWS
jgi:hypothetical protein